MEKTYEETLDLLLKMYHDTKSGHIGGGISILPSLYALFSGAFAQENDKIVFSKGHCVAALYASLNAAGFLSNSKLDTFYSNNTVLGAHTPSHLTSFIPFATGSLGHGTSLATGLALAKKLKKEAGHVFCFCGDGEWQEGSCWEALTFSVHHKLDNLTIIIDCNGWQGFGSLSAVAGIDIYALESRLTAFGAHVKIVFDNEITAITPQLLSHKQTKPSLVLVKTIKGQGLLEYEDTLASHYIQFDDVLYNRIKQQGRN